VIYFNSATPCFPVADVGATIRWYETELGFTGDPFPADEPFVFGILRRDTVEIMLQQMVGYQKQNLYDLRDGGLWDAYFRIQGVTELFESVKEKLEIVRPLRKQPYGLLEFEIRDLNGYVLVFSE